MTFADDFERMMIRLLGAGAWRVLLAAGILAALLCLAGCGTERIGVSTADAQVGIRAGQSIIAPMVSDEKLTPEQRQSLADVLAILDCSWDCLEPARKQLGGEECRSPVTAGDAVKDPRAFVKGASIRLGGAWAQYQSNQQWREVGGFAFSAIGAAVSASPWGQILVGLGGAGGAAALLLKGVSMFAENRKLKGAVEDAVDYGDEMEKANTDADVAAVKARASKKQIDNGTADVIRETLKKAKV